MERGSEGRGDIGLQIGRVARQLRDSQGLTLAEAAASAGISPAMLSRIETGGVTPSLETLVSLSAALGVRPATLLQDLGEETDGAQHVPSGRGLKWSVAVRDARHISPAGRAARATQGLRAVSGHAHRQERNVPGLPARGNGVHLHPERHDPLSARDRKLPAPARGFAFVPRRYSYTGRRSWRKYPSGCSRSSSMTSRNPQAGEGTGFVTLTGARPAARANRNRPI